MSVQIEIAPEIHAAVSAMLPDLRAALAETVRAALADRLVSVDEAAEIVQCSTGALRKRIARGTLQVVRMGRTIRIRTSDLLGEVKP